MTDVKPLQVVADDGIDVLLRSVFRTVEDNYLRRSEINGPDSLRRNYELYGFELDMDESDPNSMIRYIEDNANYQSAGMDYKNGVFNYASWYSAFFIRNIRPVMLNYDGTEEYELDPYNYKKKKDGSDSNATNVNISGNVMIAIPTVWIKVDTTNPKKPKFYFSNKQVDDSYHAYAHTNIDGEIIPYTYMSAYEGYTDTNSKIRSLSGKSTKTSTGNDCITPCRANNQGSKIIWDAHEFSDRMLITLLLMLISRSTDSQKVFGYGYTDGSSSGINTGLLDDKGLFYGYNDGTHAVKVFGIENFWGNQPKYAIGIYGTASTFQYNLVKTPELVYSGSTYIYDGYSTLAHGLPSNVSYPTDMYAGEFGLLPKALGGSESTYFCDCVLPTKESKPVPCLFGGDYGDWTNAGMFGINFSSTKKSLTYLSCKPVSDNEETLPHP